MTERPDWDFILEMIASGGSDPITEISIVAHHYRNKWRDWPEDRWLARFLQEVGELADTFTDETEDSRDLELIQLGSIIVNWLQMRRDRDA
ncbi:MAG: hypothetical protein NWE79_00750 [Candidatus Bathyarchaeota archaeon]|nr:hypothetical protein [Candidatus Bathyarchaeota archaeon]